MTYIILNELFTNSAFFTASAELFTDTLVRPVVVCVPLIGAVDQTRTRTLRYASARDLQIIDY